MNDNKPDEFQISLRILGNEVVGLRLNSSSRYRNWAAFGIVATAALIGLTVWAMPALTQVASTIGG